MDAGKFALSAGCAPPEGVAMVGFESVNTLANVGKSPWARESGLLSVWILGQFKPLPAGRVIVPFAPGEDVSLGPKATTDYFGPLSPERCRIADGYLLFACDGRYRSKIGVSPKRARGMLGSFDPDEGVLTIVEFNLPCGAPALPYVNSLWKMQDDPFAGDVVNSYNDGEVTPGAAQLGPFYEIETSSPASELPPGGAMVHVHRTYHFSGGLEGLRLIARRTLGVELSEI